MTMTLALEVVVVVVCLTWTVAVDGIVHSYRLRLLSPTKVIKFYALIGSRKVRLISNGIDPTLALLASLQSQRLCLYQMQIWFKTTILMFIWKTLRLCGWNPVILSRSVLWEDHCLAWDSCECTLASALFGLWLWVWCLFGCLFGCLCGCLFASLHSITTLLISFALYDSNKHFIVGYQLI